jgi:hypothetical protein
MRQTYLSFAGPPPRPKEEPLTGIANAVVNVRSAALKKRGIGGGFAEWAARPNALYIGREVPRAKAAASMWANPFSVERFGRDVCLEMYERYVRENPHLWDALETLDGKELGCWCHPEKCHGDVLLRLRDEKRTTTPVG